MARTPEGLRLTEANRVAQIRQAHRQTAKARIAYNRLLDVGRLDASFPKWAATMHSIVEEGFQGSATLAKPYIQRFAVAEGAAVPDLPQVTMGATKLYEDLLVNGPINIKSKIGRGLPPDAAKTAALERLLGVVQEHVMAGGRDLIAGASKYYGKSGRWRRVSDGQPCAFCAMLCARGPVYSEETVTFRSHHTCGCGAELVFGEWEPTPQERLWRASYDQAALDADEAGQKRIAPVRKDDKSVDTILWRMRRNAPELFSDGVGTSLLPALFKPGPLVRMSDVAVRDARALLLRAAGAEPAITRQMLALANGAKGHLVGLEYKFKTEVSLARKIGQDAASKGVTTELASREISDALRYTVVLKETDYAARAQRVIDELRQSGNTLVVKNFWADPVNPYQGINIQVRSSSGQRYELQLHTSKSFDVKDGPLHALYERQRVMARGAQWDELADQMAAWSHTISVPLDASLIN